MEAVTGQAFSSYEATAMDFAQHLIQDHVYPGTIPAQREKTVGRLYEGMDLRAFHLLDEFEDGVYQRELITIHTQGGEHIEAYSYILSLEHLSILSPQPWCQDSFIAHDLHDYIKSCHAFYRERTNRP